MSHRHKPRNTLPIATVELAGTTYAILPAATLAAICRKARITTTPAASPDPSPLYAAAPEDLNPAHVARRLADRRKNAGLTQGQLAQRAGVRIETVNRIERGHVTPDFRTLRKLLQAMLEAEAHPITRKE
ncbi:MAG: helix-turn-helix domain-containing protein [Phycisphaerae bacterium]